MAVTTTKTNKPINPRGDDKSPLAFNRAKIYSGKALDFDGVNDSINLNGFTMSGNTATFSFYADANNDGYFFDINLTRFLISHNEVSGQGIRIFNKDTITTYGNYPRIGILFYTIVCDGTSQSVYINGKQFGSTQTVPALDLSAASSFKIGSNFLLNGSFYDGTMSGFKIFNTALTAAQVSDLYNNPEKIVPTGVADSALKLWLPMMEGAGTTAYDGSGNGNHGTISGATWTQGVGAPVAQTAVIDWNKGTNLFKYSEQFEDTTRWGRTNTDFVVDDEVAPNGKTTAELIKETTANGPHYINGGIDTLASKTYVQSVWVKKKDDGIYAGIRTNGVGGNSYVIFDFDTATIVDSGSDIILKGVVPYPNGWYRIYMTYNLAPVGGIYSITNSSSSVIPSYTGTGKGYYIWGAQIAEANSLTAYIPNYTTTAITSDVLLPQGLTSGRDITGVNLFENVRKQYALNLDGQSWAEIHDNESLDFGTGSFSLEAWAKAKYVSQGSSLNAIMTLGDSSNAATSASINIINSGGIRPQSYYRSLGTSATNAQNEGDWFHIVGIYDGTNMNIYVNGAFDNSNARTAADITNDLVKMIGRDTTTVRYYNDQIAQPRIYNRALTADEVEQNYNAGKNTYS